jgi:uncharacterized protein (UPF0332 family)
MNARDFLNVAYELLEGNHEAHWRTAVSRAYYAAFHAARDLLVQCGFTVPREERAHTHLRMRLMNSGHPDVAQAGTWLNDLRSDRNYADYDFEGALKHADAVEAVQAADDAIQLLEEAAALPTVCQRITEAMRIYERDVLRDVTWRAP